jgi:uncharacterized protein (TIGR03118 family)
MRATRLWAALVALTVAAAAHGAGGAPARAYAIRPLVSDGGVAARVRDAQLVNWWGLAAAPTGPWWTANEARDTSTLYTGTGAKQHLTVRVGGGPTGIVWNPTRGFAVSARGASGPARFLYACEDGTIRGWSPSVPAGWSTEAVTAVDLAGEAAVFRGLALSTTGPARLYATDFHNGRVDVFDAHWRQIVRPGAFVDRAIPEWYAPFGIRAFGGRIFVTYVYRAPVNGNDAPTGGYVDEFDRDGRLVARVARLGPLHAPWGLALAPSGDLYVGNFGDGRINAFRPEGAGWRLAGPLRDGSGEPLEISGLWGISFGNGAMAGPRSTLFFASGPHRWRGATEQDVHGLVGALQQVR